MKRPMFGISPLGPSRKVKAAVRKAVGNINGSLPDRISRLQRLFFSKYGIPKENILFAGSVQELIALVCRVIAPERVLVAGPDSGMFAGVVSNAGISVNIMINATDPASPPDPMHFARRAFDYDAAYIANPNNVSGDSLDVSFPENFSGGRCPLIVDESLIGFSGTPSYMQYASLSDNVVALGTTSNYFGLAGLELAYAVATESFICELRRKKVCRVGILAVEAAMAAMKDKAFVRNSFEFIERERSLIARTARQIPECTIYKSSSNMLLVKLPCPSDDLVNAAERSGLAVRGCGNIDGLDNSFVYISIMKHDQNLKLTRLMKRLLIKRPDVEGI